MKLLLDTQALFWWMEELDADDNNVGALISDPKNEVLLSVVSSWEILVKHRAGKPSIDLNTLLRIADEEGLTRLGIEDSHLRALAALPFHHRDPFDHLLIAQAIAEGATFVTSDRAAAAYPVNVLGLV